MRPRRDPRVVRDTGAARPVAMPGRSTTNQEGAGVDVVRNVWRVRLLVAFALLALLAAGWRYWPDVAFPTATDVLASADRWHASPLAPLIALAAFVVGGFVVFPVNLLIAATIVVFGPLAGVAYALAGSTLSAAAVHETGRQLPASVFARLAGERGEGLRQRIVGHGLIAVALVRLVPVAPYSFVSLIAGAARIRRVPYLIGTALGMTPGIVLYALFVDRARAALLDPHPLAWLGVVAVVLAMVLVAVVLRRRVGAGSERT